MRDKNLNVAIGGTYAGTLVQTEAGALQFAYDEGYRGVPLSIADVFNELEATSCHVAACELRTRMEAPIAELCRKTKSDLS